MRFVLRFFLCLIDKIAMSGFLAEIAKESTSLALHLKMNYLQ